jgi:hypothetical protein
MIFSNLKQYAGASFFLLLICWQAALITAGDTMQVPTITVQDVKKLLGSPNTVIIDVRKDRNWWRSGKKILTAVREDPLQVGQWFEKYDKDQKLITRSRPPRRVWHSI